MIVLMLILMFTVPVYAQSSDQAVQVVGSFSNDLMKLLQGPIVKIVGAFVLLGGVASLIRGKHHIAVACAVAFTILLFIPSLLAKVGVSG